MSGMIFIGFDNERPKGDKSLSELINGTYWNAFGDLLDEVFLPNYPQLHESIKPEEGEYLKFYTFEDLSKDDFNLSVKLIRQHLQHMKPEDWRPRDYINDMAKWQSMARQVWEEVAEPFVVFDSRYVY
ncbi:hypothetical protein [Acinetobacter guillouiae]|uniref:hypothetical protein n=1 Tax=Acinetobacter guillouiae TaxID=106649 RepID=UPI0004EF636C|nr:hypothetical protein [Acinetobacter guillouiae]MBP2543776.1 hypothetical protein [Acinetobacter guillouiae]BAP36452.1 hypothetical protein AS4_15120 [Acinetobacter guillouiae]